MFAEGSCAAAGGARSWRFRRKATLIASGSSQTIICRLAEQIDYRLGEKARFLVAQRLHRKNWRCTHGKGRCSRSVGTVLGEYLAGHATPWPKFSGELRGPGLRAPAVQNRFRMPGQPPKSCNLYISMGESRVSTFWGILTGPPSRSSYFM